MSNDLSLPPQIAATFTINLKSSPQVTANHTIELEWFLQIVADFPIELECSPQGYGKHSNPPVRYKKGLRLSVFFFRLGRTSLALGNLIVVPVHDNTEFFH